MHKLVRRHPWQSGIVFLGVLAVTGNSASALGDAGNIAAIVAAVASVAILAAGTGRWLWRRWLLRRPLEVVYVGADLQPQEEWTVEGAGRHDLSISIGARLDVQIESVWFAFHGSPVNMPEDEGFSGATSNPVGELPSQITRGKSDFDGVVRFPRLLPKRRHIAYPRHIFATGSWDGYVHLEFALHTPDGQAAKRHVERLPFRVRGASA